MTSFEPQTADIGIHNNREAINLFGKLIRMWTGGFDDETLSAKEATHATFLLNLDGHFRRRHAAQRSYFSRPEVYEDDFTFASDLIDIVRVKESLFIDHTFYEAAKTKAAIRSRQMLGWKYDYRAALKIGMSKLHLGWLMPSATKRVMCSEFVSLCWSPDILDGLRIDPLRRTLFHPDPQAGHEMVEPVHILTSNATEIVWERG